MFVCACSDAVCLERLAWTFPLRTCFVMKRTGEGRRKRKRLCAKNMSSPRGSLTFRDFGPWTGDRILTLRTCVRTCYRRSKNPETQVFGGA